MNTKIETERQYEVLLARVEELMLTLPEDTPKDDPLMVELDILGNLVADYSEAHFSIGHASLVDTIKLRMYELGLSQIELAKKLGINASRISEILNNKREPTLAQARKISSELNIAPSIVLGL